MTSRLATAGHAPATAAPAPKRRRAASPAADAGSIACLQRQLGNRGFRQAVAGGRPLLQRCACGGTCAHCRAEEQGAPTARAKLRVGPAGDAYEREADRVADAVVRQPGGGVEGVQREPLDGAAAALQRQEGAEEEEERELVMAKRTGPGADAGGPAPAAAADVLRTPGQPLDPAVRAFMEPRFGRDFGAVRVHTGPQAEVAARSVDARAYTVGEHLVFGAGEYAPGGDAGRRLLAHELTHVVQQGAAGPGGDVGRRAPLGPRIQRGKKDAGPCAGGVKNVTVDFVRLDGTNRNPVTDLAFANTVFAPCCVQFTVGTNEPVDGPTTRSWLTDNDVKTKVSCTDVDPEEEAMRAGAAAKFTFGGKLRVYYVESMTPSKGGMTFHADCNSGARAPFAGHIYLTNSAVKRSLAHEFGHYLLNCGSACDNYKDTRNLMQQSDTATGEELDAGQCATIYGNA